MISFKKKIKIQGKTTDTTIILNPFLGETGKMIVDFVKAQITYQSIGKAQ
jgi:hypothetical protein